MATAVQEQKGAGTVRGGSFARALLGFLWRVPVSAVVYTVAMSVGGVLAVVLGLTMPKLPVQMTSQQMAQLTFLSGLIVAVGLVPLAARQTGRFVTRWLALATLAYVSHGLNTAIEASVFTTMGGMAANALVFVPPTVLIAAAVAWLFGSRQNAESLRARAAQFAASRRPAQWVWRVVLAIASFPVAYFVFGMLLMAVRPGLMEYYRSGAVGLTVPGPDVVLWVATLRSCLFLAAALPVLIMWQGSRWGLALALGLAMSALVGLSGLVSVPWMPLEMRIGHGLEITADSFAHAAALVWLLVPPRQPGAAR